MNTRMTMSTMVAVGLVAAVATADSSVDERRPAAADGRVEVECISGRIVVQGWSEDEIHVTGTLGDDVEELIFETSGNATRISVKLPRRSSRDADADLVIRVPRGSELEVETVSADIRVTELVGELDIESVSGDVKIDGDVREIQVETVSGDVEVAGASGLTSARFESVSGDIELKAAIDHSARLRFETVSGDVELSLTGSGASFDISTFSGSIRGDADDLLKRAKYGPGASGRLISGDGAAKVSIETFSGDLTLDVGPLSKQN